MKINEKNENRIRAEIFATIALIPVLAAFMVIISLNKPTADTNLQGFPSGKYSYVQPVVISNFKAEQVSAALQNSYVDRNPATSDDDKRITRIFESAITGNALARAKINVDRTSDMVVSFSDNDGDPIRTQAGPKLGDNSELIFADNVDSVTAEFIKQSYTKVTGLIGLKKDKRPITISLDSTLPPQISALYIETTNEIRFHASVLNEADSESHDRIILHTLVHSIRGKQGLSQPAAREELLAENTANKIIFKLQ